MACRGPTSRNSARSATNGRLRDECLSLTCSEPDHTGGVTRRPRLLPDLARQELQLIYDLLVERAAWPTFRTVDTRFGRLLGIDEPQAALADIPATYLPRAWRPHGFYDTDEVRLSLQGIAECDGGAEDLDLLVKFIEWGASIERQQSPSDESDLLLGSLSFATQAGLFVGAPSEDDALGVTPGHPVSTAAADDDKSPVLEEARGRISRLRLLVDLLPQFAGASGWREPWQWQVVVDPRRFRVYGKIHNVEQLLRHCTDVQRDNTAVAAVSRELMLTEVGAASDELTRVPSFFTGSADVQALPSPRVEVDAEGNTTDIEEEIPSDEPIIEPFNPERIDVITQNPTVDLLLSRLRRRALDLQPDFQRMPDIWSDQNQSRLIESMLLRIPLPTFYAAELKNESWVIVDGVQRLTAITRFIAPESVASWATPLTLHGLQYLSQYEGASFRDLPGRLQTRLLETQVVLHLIRPGTPEPAMFNIFARINTGGRPLSRQELRHALIPGPARELLGDLARSDDFLTATDGSVSPTRMDDREMVLRFIAFRLSPPDSYRPEFDDFLGQAMRKVNTLRETEKDQLRRDFGRAMRAARDIFGQHAFRKIYRTQLRRSPINKALFETVSVSLAQRSPAELDLLRHHRTDVVIRFANLLTDNVDFDRSISVGTGNAAKVRLRFSYIDDMFMEISDANTSRGD